MTEGSQCGLIIHIGLITFIHLFHVEENHQRTEQIVQRSL